MNLTKLNKKQIAANGVILYEGPSMYGGGNIVTIATGLRYPTRNPKVKNAVHVWSLPTDQHPIDARKSGGDSVVCGDCDLKSMCYVNGRVLHTIYRAWCEGKYPRATIEALDALIPRHMRIRLGAWSNPSCTPWLGVWSKLVATGRRWLSYDHAWSTINQLHRTISMASCETVRQAREARSRGWRFYLVTQVGKGEATIRRLRSLGINAIRCPYNARDPQTITCDRCLLCDGVRGRDDDRPSIVTEVHGPANTLSARNKALAVLQ